MRKEDQEGIVKKEDQEEIVKIEIHVQALQNEEKGLLEISQKENLRKEDQEEIVKKEIHVQALQNEEKTSPLKKLIKVKNVHQLKKIAALINLL